MEIPPLLLRQQKEDIVTGTEVESKALNGSKVAYDAAHLDMDKTKRAL